MDSATQTTVVVCLIAAAALVLAELRKWRMPRAVSKIIASSAFVLVALQLGGTASTYGRLMLAALALSWLGDVFLLSRRSGPFLLGLGAFLAAHVVFAVAFAQRPLSLPALAVGLVAMGCIGLVVLVWLWKHLQGSYRAAVTAYVVAIIAMCAVAIAVSAASGAWLVAAGALAFAASDVSVARDRFVSPGVANRAWGLPLYYVAQLSLALSVAGVHVHAA